jgi:peptidoglycan hydrolase-like protein with peptidoglycan-binding domain
VFTTGNRQSSSHFAVQDETVHQYVRLKDTAWQAGNWLVNLRSVGIEHSAQPGRDATDATYETSSQLIVQVCRQLGLTPSRSLLKRHSDIVATACPGTVDLDRLARRAVDIWNGTVRVPVQGEFVLAAAPVSAPAPRFTPFLTNLEPSQAYNEEVKRMQAFLVWKGYMSDQGQSDGYYGPVTQHAVNAFQKASGIVPSPAYFGWWYDRTRAAANATLQATNQA